MTPGRQAWVRALVVPGAVWALLRATGTERSWPLVPALAFTPHAALASALPLAVALRSRDRAAAAVAAASAGVLGAAVLSRPGRPATTPAGPRLTVASVNLLVGRGDPVAVRELVADHGVDVLALQEVTPEAAQALRAVGIAELLPHEHVIAARPGAAPGGGGAVWSRLPPAAHGELAGAYRQPTVRVAVTGARDVEVTAVHVHTPARTVRGVAHWTSELASMPAPEPGVHRVLAGDFNATWDHGAFRRLLRRGYVDSARATGCAWTTTWTPLRHRHPRLVLDHVLIDPRVGVVSLDVVPVPGTDHRAVVAVLALPAG